MGSKAVYKRPWLLRLVPDHFKTQGQCTKSNTCYKGSIIILRHKECVLKQYADRNIFYLPKKGTQRTIVSGIDSQSSQYIGDVCVKIFTCCAICLWFRKTQEICTKIIEKNPGNLLDVNDSFVRLRIVEIRHDYEDHLDDNELAEWYNGYKKREALKNR